MADDRRDDFDEQHPGIGDDGVEEEIHEVPADLPEGFEHFRFRASPEVADALRKMTVLGGDRGTARRRD